jgi:tetratricopeptide (TPR) repeat protein
VTRTAVVCVLILTGVGLAQSPASTAPDKDQIARWIAQLGDDDFATREQASEKLYRAGRAAEAALYQAAKEGDAEVQRRITAILDRFKWGLYPDTPEPVAAVIRRYQSGDPAKKQTAVQDLLRLGGPGCAALVKISEAESETEPREQLFAQVIQHSSVALPLLLDEGDCTALEQLLERGLQNLRVDALPTHAAYWLLRGGIDARITHFTEVADQPNQEWAAGVLAYLYRAKGDLANAVRAAKKYGRRELLQALLIEARDWKELAALYKDIKQPPSIEELGFIAAFQRLSGEPLLCAESLAGLRQAVADRGTDYSDHLVAAKALFLNDRPEEALEVLARNSNQVRMQFDILCAQMQFKEALDLLEKTPNPVPIESVLQKLSKARVCWELGEKDKAKQIFDHLAPTLRTFEKYNSGPAPFRMAIDRLIELEVRAGLREQASAHCAAMLGLPQIEQVGLLEHFFPGQGTTAAVWWQTLRTRFSNEAPTATMDRLRELMDGKTDDETVSRWAEELFDRAQKLPPPPSPVGQAVESLSSADQRLLAAAEIYLLYGQEEKGRNYLEKAASIMPMPRVLIRLGDFQADHKQWGQAAESYHKAWEADRERSLPLFLHGWALQQAGKEQEGQKAIDLAHLLPLGDEAVRDAFAAALSKRGLTEGARRERELICKVGRVASHHVSNALRASVVEALGRKDYLKAADLQEQAMTRVLDSCIHFQESSAYVLVPYQVHLWRARGLLAAGKVDEALEEAKRCRTILPGGIDVAISLVPGLDRCGRQKDADALFEDLLAVHEQHCRDYPQSASGHNNLAWLAACCRRKLDVALEHARKAVELAPEKAGFLDTLAEVYFQRGEQEQAVACIKKSIELDPKNRYFHKQLERIEAGERAADLPVNTPGE